MHLHCNISCNKNRYIQGEQPLKSEAASNLPPFCPCPVPYYGDIQTLQRDKVTAAPCRFDWNQFEVCHIAGPSPRHTSSIPIVTLTKVVTEVMRVSITKVARQQGRWIYDDPNPKQLRSMLRDLSHKLAAAVLDAWKPQTVQKSKSVPLTRQTNGSAAAPLF
eukprot:2147477-Amphidinium_carterae.1